MPPLPDIAVEPVDHAAVDDLRVAWHEEDFPGRPLGGFLGEAREVARLLNAQVLAIDEGGEPVAFAQVYVHAEHRGRGLGAAVTRAAIASADDAQELWIVADGEGRPKQLYSRLGFRPVWTAVELLRLD